MFPSIYSSSVCFLLTFPYSTLLLSLYPLHMFPSPYSLHVPFTLHFTSSLYPLYFSRSRITHVKNINF
ncbi:unnamed protein product [Meloidogyne enterolobii]|uniref:Uncharacterized protein n=1 Tax=Meloidogyne enterolobii TaxID=390850 RepID=A0ACB1B496_MELEN